MSLLREDQQGLARRFRTVSWLLFAKRLIRKYDYLSTERALSTLVLYNIIFLESTL